MGQGVAAQIFQVRRSLSVSFVLSGPSSHGLSGAYFAQSHTMDRISVISYSLSDDREV